MNNKPVEVIVAAFSSPERAGQMMADIKEGRREGLIGIIDAAVVVKDAEGKLKITDSRRRAREGFWTGGALGGLLGLFLAPPVGAMVLGVGALGALIGKLQAAPLKAEMKNIGSNLTPNSSAIVAIIEHDWVAQMEAALAAEGARVISDMIKGDIAEQLNASGNVVYTAKSGPRGIERTRTTEPMKEAYLGDAEISNEQPVEEPVGSR